MKALEIKAVFLDRDGVLIHDVHFLSDINDVMIYEDVIESLKRLKENDYLLILITNQSGVARGYFDEDFVNKTHEYLNRKFAEDNVQLDGVYYCPHHVDGKPPYNKKCSCRKPEPGLIKQAKIDFDIDLSKSYMIGDKLCDVELAINSGVRGILVETGKGASEKAEVLQSYPETTIVPNFSGAVDYILKK